MVDRVDMGGEEAEEELTLRFRGWRGWGLVSAAFGAEGVAYLTSPVFKWFISICMPSAQRFSLVAFDLVELNMRTFTERPRCDRHFE